MTAPAQRTYTDAQREAVRREGHTLIEAGAGSGKTTTLVAKLAHHLGADVLPGERAARPCTLDEVAAITFTEAAAADLKGALRERLHREYRATRDARWRRMAYAVDGARVGTIHGFCGGLLREFGVRAGLDPAFRVLDEAEAAEFRTRAAREVVLRTLGDPAGGAAPAAALALRLGVEGLVREAARLAAAGDALDAAREAGCAPGRDGPRAAPSSAHLERLRAAVSAAASAGAAPAWDERLDGEAAALGATLLGIAGEVRARHATALAAAGALDYDALVAGARALLTDHPGVRRAVRARLRWLCVDEFQDTDPAQRDVAYLVCGVREALDALDAAPGGSPAPRGFALSAPSLCVVGDPKQSLYAFRGADVSLWDAVARDFARLGAPRIALDTSFRSGAALVDYVNAAFGALMPAVDDEAAPSHEVRFRPLRPAPDASRADGAVEILLVDSPDDARTVDVRRTAEARAVAARVRALLAGGTPDGAAGLRPREVALLFRNRTHMAAYEDALRAAGVPCHVAGGAGFYGARAVLDCGLLLRAVSDAHDDVAWLGLLRSPLVGLTDDALLRVRRADPEAPLALAFARAAGATDVPPGAAAHAFAPDDARAIASARAWLDELALLRDRVPVAALLERALERTGYAAVLLRGPDGARALANVRKLVQLADAFDASADAGGASLAAFVAWLDRRRAAEARREAREGEAPLYGAGEDVVTLATVHGAKGLEWEAVVLCDLERDAAGGGFGPPACLLDPALGATLRLQERAPGAKVTRVAAAWTCAQAGAAARELAEELRVAYVAATRARARLILPARVAGAGAKPAAAACPARWLLGALGLTDGIAARSAAQGAAGDAAGEARPEHAEVAAAELAFADVAGEARLDPALLRRVAGVDAVPFGRRSATELMAFERDPAAHRRQYVLGLRPEPAAGVPHEARGAGAAPALDARTAGDLVHRLLEEDGGVARDARRDLEALLEREGMGGLPPAEVARIARLVEATRAHPDVRRLLDAEAVERELAFTWFAVVDGTPHVLHGAMDLVARVADAARAGGSAVEVLDYKTNRVAAGGEAGVAAGYATQRALYAAALAAIHAEPAAFSFFFPASGGGSRHEFDTAAVAAARAAVEARLRATAAAAAAERARGAPAP